MCSKLPTEFIIRYIADYNFHLQSRNAIIQKRKNQEQQFYAIIQPMMAKEAENEVTVLLCDETYSTIKDDPFNCYLPENKSFKDLAVDDILEAVLFWILTYTIFYYEKTIIPYHAYWCDNFLVV